MKKNSGCRWFSKRNSLPSSFLISFLSVLLISLSLGASRAAIAKPQKSESKKGETKKRESNPLASERAQKAKAQAPILSLNFGICLHTDFSEDETGYKISFNRNSRHCDAVMYEKYIKDRPQTLSEALAQTINGFDVFKNISGEFHVAGTDFSGSGFSLQAASQCQASGAVILDLARHGKKHLGRNFVDTYKAGEKDEKLPEDPVNYSGQELLFGKPIDLLKISPTVAKKLSELGNRWSDQSLGALIPFLLSNRFNDLKFHVTPLPLTTTLGQQPGIDEATAGYAQQMKQEGCSPEEIKSYTDKANSTLDTVAVYSPRHGVLINARRWNELGDLSKVALILHEALRSFQLLDDLPLGQQTLQEFVAQFVLDPPPEAQKPVRKRPKYNYLLEHLLFKSESKLDYQLPIQNRFFMKDYASILCGVNFEKSRVFKKDYTLEMLAELRSKSSLFPVAENFRSQDFSGYSDSQIIDIFRRAKLLRRLKQVAAQYSKFEKDENGENATDRLLQIALFTGSQIHKNLENEFPSNVKYMSTPPPHWLIEDDSLFSQQGWLYFLNRFQQHRKKSCQIFLQKIPKTTQEKNEFRQRYGVLVWMAQMAANAVTHVEGVDFSGELSDRILVTENWPINPYDLIVRDEAFGYARQFGSQWPSMKESIESFYINWLRQKGELNYLLKRRFNRLPSLGRVIRDKDQR